MFNSSNINPLSPGPGSYDLGTEVKAAPKPSFGTEKRFGYVERDLKKLPNPEQLGPDVNSQTFVKKTFNITIED
jgi:hypothetical protein